MITSYAMPRLGSYIPEAVSYSSQILKVKFFTLDDDELGIPSRSIVPKLEKV